MLALDVVIESVPCYGVFDEASESGDIMINLLLDEARYVLQQLRRPTGRYHRISLFLMALFFLRTKKGENADPQGVFIENSFLTVLFFSRTKKGRGKSGCFFS